MTSPSPDGLSRKRFERASAVLAAAYALSFASAGIQLPLTSTAMERVGLSMTAIGVMWGSRSVLNIFGPALLGVLADRHGDARPFAVGSLLSGAALLLLLSATTSALPAIVLFGLYGLLCGPASSLLDGMLLTALGDARHRFGRWRAWGTIGFGVTALSSALLIDRGLIEPLPAVLFPACALLTAAAGVAILFLPRLPRPALGRLRDVLPVLMRPDMVALFATSTLLWCSHIGFATFITPLATARGLPEWSVGVSIAAAIVVEALMLRHSGFFLTRWGGRMVIVSICALTVLRWVALALTTDPAAFIALHALHGVTFGLFFATLVTLLAARVPPQMRQATQGIVASSSFGLGGALGALLAGGVLERYDASTTWLSMSAVASVALVVAWRFVKDPPKATRNGVLGSP
jgi:MFS transporter, PPP family, 3-phenylpropionic acid transporter